MRAHAHAQPVRTRRERPDGVVIALVPTLIGRLIDSDRRTRDIDRRGHRNRRRRGAEEESLAAPRHSRHAGRGLGVEAESRVAQITLSRQGRQQVPKRRRGVRDDGRAHVLAGQPCVRQLEGAGRDGGTQGAPPRSGGEGHLRGHLTGGDRDRRARDEVAELCSAGREAGGAGRDQTLDDLRLRVVQTEGDPVQADAEAVGGVGGAVVPAQVRGLVGTDLGDPGHWGGDGGDHGSSDGGRDGRNHPRDRDAAEDEGSGGDCADPSPCILHSHVNLFLWFSGAKP